MLSLGLNAHSAIFVFASTIAPASLSFRIMKASSSGTLFRSAIDPPVVTMSAVSKLSFTSSGAQNSGGISIPFAKAESISSARRRALGFISVIALIPLGWSYAAILSR